MKTNQSTGKLNKHDEHHPKPNEFVPQSVSFVVTKPILDLVFDKFNKVVLDKRITALKNPYAVTNLFKIS
jgi:hypothetical protein